MERWGRGEEGERAVFALGLVVLAIVAIADVATGKSVSLIGYLVLGPLIAATRAGPRAVAALVVLALLATLPLAAANDIFFELRHVVAIGLVATGGALAILLSHALGDLRTTRARDAIARGRLSLIDRSSRLIAAPLNAATRLEELTVLPIPDLAPLCVVDLLDEDGTISGVVVSAEREEHAEAVREMRRRFPLALDGPHPASTVLRTGEPQLLAALDDDLTPFTSDPQHAQLINGMAYGSAIVAPLVARGRTLGVMSLLRFRGQPPFDDTDLAVVTDLAARSAIAVDNARLFDELRRAEGRLEAILSVVAEAVTVQDREGKLVYVNEAALRLLGATATGDLLDEPPQAIVDRYEMFDEHGERIDPEQLPGRAALRGEDPQPLLVRGINRTSGIERWTLVKASSVRDEHGTPVLAVNIIEDVTDERRRGERAALLAEASNLLASASEFETGLRQLATTLVPRLGDSCTISLADERRDLVEVACVPGDATTAVETEQVLVTGQPVLRDDGTAIVVPLLAAADEPIGVLALSLRDTMRRFGASDLVLADELGRRVGLAVEHARVHRERTHIAATLQRSLLPPRLPDIAGMRIAARFRAAGASNQVGGDFYDVFEVDGGWIVVIGDVTGKGADAAAITALARYTMRTAARYEPAPSDILDRLNEALLREAGERRRLCTAICLRIEDNGGAHPIRASLACAGHPPPYLLSDRGIVSLSTPGPLLGAFDDGAWGETVLELATGDCLVLYTDGVTDAHGAGQERFGDERLRRALAEAARSDADGLAAAIDAALEGFQEGPQRDDVALLVLSAGQGSAHGDSPGDAAAAIPAST